MNFQFNETQQLIRETATKFANDRLAHGSVERDEQERFPVDEVRPLGGCVAGLASCLRWACDDRRVET